MIFGPSPLLGSLLTSGQAQGPQMLCPVRMVFRHTLQGGGYLILCLGDCLGHPQYLCLQLIDPRPGIPHIM